MLQLRPNCQACDRDLPPAALLGKYPASMERGHRDDSR
jgi:hypothetical protein